MTMMKTTRALGFVVVAGLLVWSPRTAGAGPYCWTEYHPTDTCGFISWFASYCDGYENCGEQRPGFCWEEWRKCDDWCWDQWTLVMYFDCDDGVDCRAVCECWPLMC
jgi:hypothetical protein